MSPAPAPAAAAASPYGTIAREVGKIVMDVLQEEMVLDAEHCLLGNQDWKMPPDQKLFVVIFDGAGPVIGQTTYTDMDPESPTLGLEIQEQAVVHDVRLESFSFDDEARVRKEEIGMALGSYFAQLQESRWRVQIARAQTPVDASDTEVTERLLKYVTHVNVTALHRKVKTNAPAPYYDKFNGASVNGTANIPATSLES